MFSILFAALVTFSVFIVLSLVVFRLNKIKARTLTLTIVMILCTPLIWPFLEWGSTFDLNSRDWRLFFFVLNTVLIFTLLWFGYLQFYFSFERSPSLRFLVETLENHGSHTAEALHQKYSFDDVIRRRIEQMAEVRLLLIIQENGQKKYFNSPKGRRVGQFCGLMKKFMQLGDGG